MSQAHNYIYIGTYTSGTSQGIHVCSFDLTTGRLQVLDEIPGIDQPSFLTFSPYQRYLYAVNETLTFGGAPGGGVSAFRIDSETGGLTLINQQLTHGTAPCHITIDASGRMAIVANYGSGSITVFPIRQDGGLGPASDNHQSTRFPDRLYRPTGHLHRRCRGRNLLSVVQGWRCHRWCDQ